jgi:mannose-6-phosphate isomerase-like protein (cupin superfamily)
MDRREFSALLPMLFAAPALTATAEAQAAGSQTAAAPALPPKLASGQYVWGEAYGGQRPSRTSHRFLIGMLPDNIRLEAHVTFLVPGAPAEPIEHHKHSEMWFVREGTVTLMTAGVTRTLKAGDMGLCIAGDDHYVTNASKTEPASYFVLTVGPPE